MLLITLLPPTVEEQKRVCEEGTRCGFNFAFPGATQLPVLPPDVQRGWWRVDKTRVKVGYGGQTYQDARQLLGRWGHMQLPWARVAPETPTAAGSAVCITARVFGLWTAVPLKITYRKDERWRPARAPTAPPRRRSPHGQRCAFAQGCLGGHYLAGEERFAVEWDPADDSVWYEISSFSRPDHPLAYLGFPVVRWLQRSFREQSTRDVARQLSRAALERSARKYAHAPSPACEGARGAEGGRAG